MLNVPSASRGFTLIELMVTLALVALLMMIAVPSISSWMADARVRAAGEALQNAARIAQGEAIRRSRSSMLVLTLATPGLDAAPTANAQHWYAEVVPLASDSASDAAGRYLRGGTDPSAMNVAVSGPAVVCFNAFGQLTALTAAQTGLGAACDLTLPKEISLSASGATRSMKVQIALGGRVRLCDASKTLSNTTPDGC